MGSSAGKLDEHVEDSPRRFSTEELDAAVLSSKELEPAILSFNASSDEQRNEQVQVEDQNQQVMTRPGLKFHDYMDEIDAVEYLIARKRQGPLIAEQLGLEAAGAARTASKNASQQAMIARMVAGARDLGDMVQNASTDGANWLLSRKDANHLDSMPFAS